MGIQYAEYAKSDCLHSRFHCNNMPLILIRLAKYAELVILGGVVLPIVAEAQCKVHGVPAENAVVINDRVVIVPIRCHEPEARRAVPNFKQIALIGVQINGIDFNFKQGDLNMVIILNIFVPRNGR